MGSGDASVHRERKAAIQREFPEVSKLMGHDTRTQYYAYGLFFMQVFLAYCVRSSFVGAVMLGVTVSPYACFGVLVLIHEVSHCLVFSKVTYNRLLGLFCNLVFLSPVSEVFKQHHNMHHSHLGDVSKDVDVPGEREMKAVGHSPVLKTMWLLLSVFILPIRSVLKLPVKWNRFMVLNWVTCVCFVAFVAYNSRSSLLYLFLGMVLSQSMHPANARQVQRHIKVYKKENKDGEDTRKEVPIHERTVNTFSYYGPQNYFTLNVGYHVEHHDFGNIPWTRLPTLHKMAGEKWYPKSAAYSTRGISEIIAFITNPMISLADYAGRPAAK